MIVDVVLPQRQCAVSFLSTGFG